MANYVGPGSKFAAICGNPSIKDNNDGTYTATFECYISVQAGTNGFQGTNITTNWSAGTVAVYSSDTGTGTATVNASYGQAASFTAKAYYTSGSGTYYESTDTKTSEAYNPVFTITYDANGGSGAPASQTKKKGESITLSTTIPVKDGYKFVGWSRAVGYQVWYQPGDVYSEDVSRTLYAVWEKKYILSLDPNGGNNSNPKVTVVSNQSDNSTLPEAALSVRDNCEFLGYFTEETGGVKIYDSSGANTNDGTYWRDDEYVYGNNATLYAHWEVVNTIYYKNNDNYVLCNTYIKKNNAYVLETMYLKINGKYYRNAGSASLGTLESISVTYTGSEVKEGTKISDLVGINVIGHYSDGYNVIIKNYSLPDGEIVEGENNILVSYQGKTVSFIVTGTTSAYFLGEEQDCVVATWTESAAPSIGGTPMDKQRRAVNYHTRVLIRDEMIVIGTSTDHSYSTAYFYTTKSENYNDNDYSSILGKYVAIGNYVYYISENATHIQERKETQNPIWSGKDKKETIVYTPAYMVIPLEFKEMTGINIAYHGSTNVEKNLQIDQLRNNLTVTVIYKDGHTRDTVGYFLTGNTNMQEGENIITVNCYGYTQTFIVNGIATE